MSVISDCILLSIGPEHARSIYSGRKRAELRKSFSAAARLVFLYETIPVAAVTGAFTVKLARKTTTPRAIRLATGLGIDPSRAKAYYGKRQSGWVVSIGVAARFARPIPISKLRAIDHYFAVPRAFGYLPRFDAVTQILLRAFQETCSQHVRLRPLKSGAQAQLRGLIRHEVAQVYEDIDPDFVEQTLKRASTEERAFSTKKKHVLEAVWKGTRVGYTILTEKTYGAWKTGPTIVVPKLRGIGLGQAIRDQIVGYCRRRRARRIFCTCAADNSQVVSYLLASGLQVEARLQRHLGRDRDELVLGMQLQAMGRPRVNRRRALHSAVSARRIVAGDPKLRAAVDYFIKHLAHWYFTPHRGLKQAITESIEAWDQGERRYSAKGRRGYALFERTGRIVGVAVLTPKRSNMLKLNYVADTGDEQFHSVLIRALLESAPSPRRIYVTVPTSQAEAIIAFDSCGFGCEGVLRNPFGMGVNHAVLGYFPRNPLPAGN